MHMKARDFRISK